MAPCRSKSQFVIQKFKNISIRHVLGYQFSFSFEIYEKIKENCCGLDVDWNVY